MCVSKMVPMLINPISFTLMMPQKAGTSSSHNSIPYTKVLGYVACRTTSKRFGEGSAKKLWNDVKQIKDGKKPDLRYSSLEKCTILFSSTKPNEAQIKKSHEDSSDIMDDFLAMMTYSN